jgi:hypothetical protein
MYRANDLLNRRNRYFFPKFNRKTTYSGNYSLIFIQGLRRMTLNIQDRSKNLVAVASNDVSVTRSAKCTVLVSHR